MRAEEEISTRTLVMTMIGDDGGLDAQRLYDTAGACGMSDQQVRLCLRRLVADATLEHRGGRGRRASFALRDAAAGAVLPELELVEFAFQQDAGQAPWDGWWRLVAFNLDQSRRTERDELRARLLYLGGAPLHAGLYVSPNGWEELVAAEAARLGVAADLLTLRSDRLDVGGEDDPATLAGRLWSLEEVAAGHRAFTAVVEERLARLGDGEDEVVRAALRTIVDFARAMGADPLLPPELLPDTWPGCAARQMMRRAGEEFERRAGDALPPALRRLRVGSRPS